MRARDFIKELRRNPEQNVRVSGWDQFVQIYNQHKQQGNPSNLYISLTELEKLGINPLSEHETPNGVYAYPADYVIKTKSFEDLPYAGDQKWVNVFTVTPEANILKVDTVGSDEVKEYLKRLVTAYPERADEIKQFAKSAPKEAFANDGWDDIPNRKKLKKLPGAQLWYITFELSEYDSNLWNKLFRVMGIDGVADSGMGIIHHMEPVQAVFFNPKAIKMIGRFPNSAAPTEKSITNRRKEGQQQTQTKRNLNSMSERDQIEWMNRNHYHEHFRYIRNPSPKVQKAAIKLDPRNILWIKNPSPELLMYAVKKEPHLLDHFKNQTFELQMAAIGKDWSNIEYLDHPLPQTVQQVMSMIPRKELEQLYQDQIEYIENGWGNPPYSWLPPLR